MRRLLLVALLVAVVAVAHYGFRVGGPAAQTPAAASPSAPRPAAADPPSASSSTPSATSSSAGVDEDADGALARAWLTAFLTRPNRDDLMWVDAVKPLSTPDLVTDLRAAGPDRVGLDQLSSWRVMEVVPFKTVDLPADTETRRMLDYAAVVTDGTHTAKKPFELYAYRQDDGRWLIGAIDEPHSGEG